MKTPDSPRARKQIVKTAAQARRQRFQVGPLASSCRPDPLSRVRNRTPVIDLTSVWITILLPIAALALVGCTVAVQAEPTAERWEFSRPRIFVQDAVSRFEYLELQAPAAGEATLRLINAGRKAAPENARLESAEVTVNGKEVISAKEFGPQVDKLSVPIRLATGSNRIGVRLPASSARVPDLERKRLSLEVDPVANRIDISPARATALVDGWPLQLDATVTGAGVPLRGVTVSFSPPGLPEQTAVTNGNGRARVALIGLSPPGKQVIKASVVGTDLSSQIPVSILRKQHIALSSKVSQVTLQSRVAASIAFDVQLDGGDGQPQAVELGYTVEPMPSDEASDITVTLPERLSIADQRRVPVQAVIVANRPGPFQLTLTATLKDGETATAKVALVVRPPLHLNLPLASPMALRPGKASLVTFRTLVSGAPIPQGAPYLRTRALAGNVIAEPIADIPEALVLEEVTREGKLLRERIAVLRDDGKGVDSLAGDGFYATAVELESDTETERFFRLRAELAGDTLLSGIATLPVTKLPIGRYVSDPKQLIVDRESGDRLYANEVILASGLDVSPRRLRRIVEEVSKELGEPIEIVDYLPPLALYLVRIRGDGRIEAVRRAAESFSNYAEIAAAGANILGELAATPTDARFPPNMPTCGSTPDADSDGNPENVAACQYYLYDIRAPEAWDYLTSRGAPLGSATVKVAVIDTGVDATNPDLTGQVTDSQTGLTNNHGTRVTGLIAGLQNNAGGKGIAGIAPGTTVGSVNMATSGPSTWEGAVATTGTTLGEAKIFNMSWGYSGTSNSNLPALERFVCAAVCADRLLVAAAGNSCIAGHYRPAEYNDGSLTCDDTVTSHCAGETVDASTRLLAVGALDLDVDEDGEVDNPYSSAVAADMHDVGQSVGCSHVRPWVELYAPGDQIVTTHPGESWVTAGGTSFATPLVSGAAALVWAADPSLSPSDVEQLLRDNAPLLSPTPQTHPLLDTPAELAANLDPNAKRLDLLSSACATLNSPPAITSPAAVTVSEGVSDFLTVNAIDPDADAPEFTITGGADQALFAIDSASGALSFITPPAFASPSDADGNNVYEVTVTAEDGCGATADQVITVTVTDSLSLQLVVDTPFQRSDAFGNTVWHYPLRVVNWEQVPANLFGPRPDLPPCGLNTNASRTWVRIYDASDDSYIYGFCALSDRSFLADRLWFAVLPGDTPPSEVYVTLDVRDTGAIHQSNDATVPPTP